MGGGRGGNLDINMMYGIGGLLENLGNILHHDDREDQSIPIMPPP